VTLREAIVEGMKEWGHTDPEAHCPSQVAKIEHHVSAWVLDRDCRLEQLIALKEAGMSPCLRDATKACNEWNLQLSPEAGHVIDFDGATLEDVLKEACAKYLSKEQRHEVS